MELAIRDGNPGAIVSTAVTFTGRIELDWISRDGSYTVSRSRAYVTKSDILPEIHRLFVVMERAAVRQNGS